MMFILYTMYILIYRRIYLFFMEYTMYILIYRCIYFYKVTATSLQRRSEKFIALYTMFS